MKNKPASTNHKVTLANKRMGITLLTVALAFFVGIFISRIFLG